MLITIIFLIGVGLVSYWRGYKDGSEKAFASIRKPAVEFIDAFYPFGVPDVPRNDLDVMAQVLEPITKL
jgi:hypothetical protein